MRMERIEVDQEVFEKLQGLAEPLVDDANSVLRRVLGISGNESGATSTPRPPASPTSGDADSLTVDSRRKAQHDQHSTNRREARFREVAGQSISDIVQTFEDLPDALQSLVRSLDGEQIVWIDDLPGLASHQEIPEGLEWHDVIIYGVQSYQLSVWDDRVRTDVAGYWPWTDGAARAFGQGRARRGSLLPQAFYEMPVLESLIELGGSAPSSVVIDRVGAKLEAKFTDIDREKTSGKGVVRWRNRTQFARQSLIDKGEMRRDSPHGVWEISAAGRDRAKSEATT